MTLPCIRQHHNFTLQASLWCIIRVYALSDPQILTLYILARLNVWKEASSENTTHYR